MARALSPLPALFAVFLVATLLAPAGSRAQEPRDRPDAAYQKLVHRFDYDTSAPLDIREAGVERRGPVAIHDISYASAKGGRVPAYLVVPDGPGPFAAVIWGHWYWGNSAFRNRREFLDEAVALAGSGAVSLLFDGPVARPGFYEDRTPLNEKQIADRMQSILDVRRAADLLLARKDVDRRRLAYVGHSYNAATGGYLAGVDKRFNAFVLMAGPLSDKVDLETDAYRTYRERVGPEKFDAFVGRYAWLDPGVYLPHAAPAAVLMQFATRESFLTPARARRYAELVSEPKEFRMYDAPHALNAAARHDRIEFLRQQLRLREVDWSAIESVPDLPQPPDTPPVQRKTCTAADGVPIVYSTAGKGETALLFIHGGLADRSFFNPQFNALSDDYRVIALDLAGHGESGVNRKTWSMAQFGGDVAAVADAEHLTRIVLLGNSLGGPVAVEATLRLGDRVIGVIGIDTFQDVGHSRTPEYARAEREATSKRLEAFRADYAAAVRSMGKLLFHPDADPWLVAEAERRMLKTSPEAAVQMLAGIEGYDSDASVRKLRVPLRAINGDLYATNVEQIRTVKPDFDAVIMKHMGHYPMLERPDEFTALVKQVVDALPKTP